MPAVVDIVVPAYNAAKTLAAALDSAAIHGSLAEIMVIDDGSSDGSLEIAKQFSSALRVLSGANRGVSYARNWGIAETTSEWVIFLDADDLLAPHTVEKRLEVANRTGADVVICDWVDFYERSPISPFDLSNSRSIDWSALHHDAEFATATSVWATTSAIMYRRTIVEKIGGFRDDLPVIQDARFLFDAARYGARFAYAPHVGAYYRISETSLSRKNKGRFWIDVLRNGQQIEALWRGDGALSEARREGLRGIYNNAARGLFSACRPEYFDAVAALKALKLDMPIHSKFAAPLARTVGLEAAQRILSFVGRG